MMVFIDTSIWIGYFSKGYYEQLDLLIKNDLVVVNDIIIAELVPFLHNAKAHELKDAILSLPKNKLDIQWDRLIDTQKINLANGINKVGIPDLIILQNVVQNNQMLWTNDKHFYLMQEFTDLKLFDQTL
ncbi:MAG: PIN domain-containing protein [Saprospiraceae bacterium]|nr:PIN domain-containing protein [Saprospiraceae bacterium]